MYALSLNDMKIHLQLQLGVRSTGKWRNSDCGIKRNSSSPHWASIPGKVL